MLLARRGKATPIGHKEILHLVRLAKAVQGGGLGVFPHADGPHLVASKSRGAGALLKKHIPGKLGNNLLKTLLPPLPDLHVVLDVLEVDDWNRNAMRIHPVLVDGN